MSKGIIKANLGEGLYEVEIVRDIAAIDAKIATLTTKLEVITAKQAELEEENRDLLAMQKQIEVQIAELERIKANDMIFEMESVTKDDSLAVDLEVGVIERREASKAFKRYINEPAAYDEVRDGKVKSVGVMNKWSWLYGALTMPIAEVWKPRYWNCTIDAISEDNKTGDVTIKPIKPGGTALYPLSKDKFSGVIAGINDEVTDFSLKEVGDTGIIDFVTDKDNPRFVAKPTSNQEPDTGNPVDNQDVQDLLDQGYEKVGIVHMFSFIDVSRYMYENGPMWDAKGWAIRTTTDPRDSGVFEYVKDGALHIYQRHMINDVVTLDYLVKTYNYVNTNPDEFYENGVMFGHVNSWSGGYTYHDLFLRISDFSATKQSLSSTSSTVKNSGYRSTHTDFYAVYTTEFTDTGIYNLGQLDPVKGVSGYLMAKPR